MACIRARLLVSPRPGVRLWRGRPLGYRSLKAGGQVSNWRMHLSKWHPGIVLVSVQYKGCKHPVCKMCLILLEVKRQVDHHLLITYLVCISMPEYRSVSLELAVWCFLLLIIWFDFLNLSVPPNFSFFGKVYRGQYCPVYMLHTGVPQFSSVWMKTSISFYWAPHLKVKTGSSLCSFHFSHYVKFECNNGLKYWN